MCAEGGSDMTDLVRRPRALLGAVAALWLGTALVMPAQAQQYPDRPIKVTVGFPAGSGADILCRWIIDGMAKASGATFVVENKPGAAGNIGSDAVAKSKPDGYMLLMGASSTQAGNPQIYNNLPWDPLKSFEPVATFSQLAYTLTVAADNPAKTVAELTQQLKAKAGKATFGFGNTSSLAAASLYTHEAGITATSVAYKSTPQALSDIAAGQTDFMFSEPVLAIGQEKAGKVRNLAVTSPQRMISLPNVPTMREVGLPNATMSPWWAVYTPAGTPPAIVAKLAEWANAATTSPETREFMLKQGLEPFPGTPDSTRKHLTATIEEWSRILKVTKIEPQ